MTSDAAAARQRAATVFSIYGHLPSYRAMLDREGAAGPADVAVVGSESEVQATVRRLAAAGATEFCGAPFGSETEIRASVAALAALVELNADGRHPASRHARRRPGPGRPQRLTRVYLNSLSSGCPSIRSSTRSTRSRPRSPSPSGRSMRRTNTARSSTMKVGTPKTSRAATACFVFVANDLRRPTGVDLGEHQVGVYPGIGSAPR